MNKKIDTSNLLIKFFLFVIAYQLVSHWVTRETANTVSLQENNTMSKVVKGEMDNLSESYWSRYLCKKSNSHYIFYKTLLFSRIYEMKEVKFRGEVYEQTPADKLNNIEKTGSLFITAVASRYYDIEDRKRSAWQNFAPYINVSAKKINGEWQVENNNSYKIPDCSHLPE